MWFLLDILIKRKMEALIQIITEALNDAKSDRKKCWREDIEEKAFADGEIRAYQYCLAMIKNEKANQPLTQ